MNRWRSSLLASAMAAVAVLGFGCGQRDENARREATTRPLADPPGSADRGGAGDRAGGTSSQIIIAGSGTPHRLEAGAAADLPSSGGGGGGQAAADAELLARCDRLVEHIVGLTRSQLPSGAARDKLEAQNDGLRALCVSMGVKASDYEACVLRARDLVAALACNPIGDSRTAAAFAQARELAGRKDLLEKAEQKIGKAGGSESGPEGEASPATDKTDDTRDLPPEHFLR